ncbi:MAG: enoyl-CoA hydratase-related protein [Geminicoccaceae bacterium]|nr:enoyl-CoA hydratase-related protein [Geminicoccaceae bacterium]MDW8124444.1 enoyl-CoA hydratase-related protein [Geminicoccaceae bacterium]MDW8341797.1 enoyl-CoA hydratase-related protein [Geminicoccaceae bacterium]
MSGTVHLETVEPGIVRVVIDQPERLNAINRAMWDRLGAILSELDRDESLRCAILAGRGERAFSVGADITEFEAIRSTVDKAKAYAERTHAALGALRGLRHPVVAAIEGLCVGGGLELACNADLRICGRSSRFGIPIKRLGLVVAYRELAPLVQLVGKANALRILLEGDLLDAEEALRIGLVNRVVADGRVMDEALATARRIAEGAPLVARWHKKFVNRLMDPRPLSPEEEDESYLCFGTEDFREGTRAFLEKRKPVFVGR